MAPTSLLPRVELIPAGQVDCTNITSAFSSSCWDTLNIPDYLGNHQYGWIYNTPTCDNSTDNGVNEIGCCAPEEPWSTCFLRVGRGLPGAQCVTISEGDCSWDEKQLNSSMTDLEQAKARYVIWNIVSMNHFFDTYFTALQGAVPRATLMVDSLTLLLDPTKKPSISLMTILSVLAVAFCFLGLPAVLDGIASAATLATAKTLSLILQKTVKNAAQGFALAAAGTPSLTKALWPQGDTQSQSQQEANLDDVLGQASSQIGDTLNNGLGVLMTDPWSFNTFGAHGAYSDQVQQSVPQDEDALALALQTLLTGESLQQNEWVANASPNTTYTSGSDHISDCSTQGGGIYSCKGDGYFLSGDTGRWYALKSHKKGGDGSLNILQQIASNSWADLNTLFDGAYNCTAEGKAGGNPVSTNADGTLDMSCISVLPMYVPKDYGCPAPLGSDGKCPFWEGTL